MGATDIIIRKANPADAGSIAELVRRLAQATGETDKVKSCADDFLRFGFSTPPAFIALLAERDGSAVGLSLWFYDFSSWRGELGVYLQDLYVDDDLRGSGLGRRLLAATAAAAIADGATHLRLSVAADNAAARRFYQHLGFTHRDDERTYQVSDEAFTSLATDHNQQEAVQ